MMVGGCIRAAFQQQRHSLQSHSSSAASSGKQFIPSSKLIREQKEQPATCVVAQLAAPCKDLLMVPPWLWASWPSMGTTKASLSGPLSCTRHACLILPSPT
jgi:hypothetical protein